MEMDQDVAQTLFMQGATLVLLDVPIGTDIGIDIKSWNTEENFKGIKMIPPGIHYVHYRCNMCFDNSVMLSIRL